ncbi:IS982 family transposase, partial [Victivallis vadensis]
MEIAGESLGMDCDKTIHRYFRDHWRHLFPNLGTRTTFLRQAANLWRVKQEIRRILLTRLLPNGSRISIVDGFPMPVCGFRRAHFSKLFKGEATYGYCAAKAMTYYGLKGHLLIDLSGIIVDCTVASANIDEREMLLEMHSEPGSIVLGDKGYICNKTMKAEFGALGILLHTPLR